jgi:hypothetical protein
MFLMGDRPMKTLVCSIVAALFVVAGSLIADDKWFDMEKCAICKCLAKHQELMTDVKWEVHPITDGMIMVAVVPEELKDTMKAAHEEMEAAVKRLEKGETMELCGFCKSFGALKKAGAKEQKIEIAAGSITLVTSDDPAVVKLIHEHAKKTQEAHKKMTSESSGSTGK